MRGGTTTNSLLDIIGRTDRQAQALAQKKGPYRGPLSLRSARGILTELSQSCRGFLSAYSISNSLKMPLAVYANLASGLFLRYHSYLWATSLPKKINCSSVKSLYILVIMTSFGCAGLKGGVTLKYNEVASEGEAVILECKSREVKLNSQEVNVPPSESSSTKALKKEKSK